MHDRKNPCPPKIILLNHLEILKKPPNLRRMLQHTLRKIRRNQSINFPRFQHRPQFLPLGNISNRHIRRMRMRNKIDSLQRPVKTTYNPTAGLRFESKLIHQNALWNQPRIMTVECKLTDRLTIQIFRPLNATALMNKDRRMAKSPIRKYRDRHERRFPTAKSPQKVSKAKLRYVITAFANHASEDLRN